MSINIHRPLNMIVGRVWTFFVLGEGDFFAGQTVKLWHFDEDFRWWKPRLHPPNGRCAMRIFKTTTNLNLQHASAKPFMMIAACTLTNQEKILQKLNRIPPPYIKYTFSSLMFWFVKKIKTRDFNVHNSSNFFACFAPFNSFWCVFLFFFWKKMEGTSTARFTPTPQLTQSMGLEAPPTHRQLHSTFSLLLWRFVTRTAASSTDVVCIDIYIYIL